MFVLSGGRYVLGLGFGPVFRLMPNPAATVMTRQRETPSVRATCS
jgi:hypothetical protein